MQEVYSISQLVPIGYARSILYEVARSEDFTLAGGFRGTGRRTKIYFNREKLDKYLRKRTDWRTV